MLLCRISISISFHRLSSRSIRTSTSTSLQLFRRQARQPLVQVPVVQQQHLQRQSNLLAFGSTGQQVISASNERILMSSSYSTKSNIVNEEVEQEQTQTQTQAVTEEEGNSDGPVAASIRAKLTEQFQAVDLASYHMQLSPLHVQVRNESYMHNVPKGSETHFKVVVVSPLFQGASPVQRHRMVHAALAQELQTGVHALSIVAKTPQQWDDMQAQGKTVMDPSPPCRGGGAGSRSTRK